MDIFFRVRRKIDSCRINVVSEGEVIASFKREFVAPGEMQKITLPRLLLDKASGDITVSVAEIAEE